MPLLFAGTRLDFRVAALKPVRHRVDNTEKPTFCKLCGGLHGLGDKN